MKEIVFAGGCFWGVEAYFDRLYGVLATESGYANGQGVPSYQGLCAGYFDHAEAVKISYDEEKISIFYLLAHFFRVVDPTSLNRQGPDIGKQYRSGIYYKDPEEGRRIKEMVELYKEDYKEPLVVEILPLENFYRAEDYHQDYLVKNPGGYCHIPLWLAEEVFIPEKLYRFLEPGSFDSPPEKNLPGIYVNRRGLPLYLSKQRTEEGFSGKALVDAPVDEIYFVAKEDMQRLGYGYLLENL